MAEKLVSFLQACYQPFLETGHTYDGEVETLSHV